MSGGVWAVVVTWNRRVLLEQCLQALMAQTRACDRVLVVDNASDDGTAERLAAWGDRITVLRLDRNTGGAGGFSAGVRAAVQGGADRVWLMDDDVLPDPQGLERLLAAEQALAARGVEAAFLCSTVRTPQGALTNVAEVDGRLNDLGYAAWGEHLDLGLMATRQATFVSLLASRDQVLARGLPLAPMFIWGDDTEYTLRLSKDRPGFVVGDSRAVHVRAAPGALSLAHETEPGRIRLHRLLTRNVILTKRRHEGRASAARYAASRVRMAAGLAVRGQWRKAGVLLAGVIDGLGFDPEVEFCEAR
ncbi:glycosyltransferase [Brevundimonas nasdae]|uniref:Glycosyltransferase n=1 Tax=Brevundimonas nasdae TaxID=172043 RepID=A0ABX8TLA3_9CAUL|nr:glycosyltransferase [Brevundimonas nasdae]QYC12021.1 glycosyltransferase [Brevundimonas nasdae]QYC14808.1 glycosyltransferase [Brevundimonas nasdae]